jgi:hypothetical protein
MDKEKLEKAKCTGASLAEKKIMGNDSVEKIPKEIDNIQKLNTTLHNQIITLCATQIDEAKQGLQILSNSKKIIGDIKEK